MQVVIFWCWFPVASQTAVGVLCSPLSHPHFLPLCLALRSLLLTLPVHCAKSTSDCKQERKPAAAWWSRLSLWDLKWMDAVIPPCFNLIAIWIITCFFVFRTQHGRDAHCGLACGRGSHRRGHLQGWVQLCQSGCWHACLTNSPIIVSNAAIDICLFYTVADAICYFFIGV